MPERQKPLQRHQIVPILVVVMSGSCLFAQGTSLSLASGSGTQGGSVALNLSMTASGNAPSGVQWKLSYPTSDVSSLSTAAGPALTAAGKAVNCSAASGSITCLASGMNANPIGNGVVAVVTVNLTP